MKASSGSKSPVYIGAGNTDFTVEEAISIVAEKPVIENHETTCQRYAQLSGSTVTNANTGYDTNLYSAFEYAQGTTSNTGGSARDFAVKINGAVSGDTANHSAKAWAIGGTGVTSTANKGSAKEWANTTGAKVDGNSGDYSAKEHAVGTVVTGGSSKQWATKTGSTVDSTEYSAKEYSQGTDIHSGSAKQWALGGGTGFSSNTEVEGGNFSAKKYSANSATSASEAATSATAAATSATAAETAHTAMNTIFDNFDDRFLGTKGTDPTTDNDGDTISVGACYYNNTDGVIKFYDGSGWESAEGSAAASAAAAQEHRLACGDLLTTVQQYSSMTELNKNIAFSNANDAIAHAAQASSSKNAAASSATGASSSATAAAASEAAAAASLDAFDDRFLGVKTSDPTLDNDGDALLDGCLYWNTTNNDLRVYDLGNTSWTSILPSATLLTQISILTEKYDGSTTATSGTNTNIAQVDKVADDIADVNSCANNMTAITIATTAPLPTNMATCAGIAANINTVAGKDTEIGRLGTSAMGTASTGHLALLGTDAMANATTGKLKVVADNITGINSFHDRYRVASSAPSSSNDEGDLYYDTSSNMLKYYNGTTWDNLGVTLAQVQTEANNASVAMSIALG